jgi:hypothetical protein
VLPVPPGPRNGAVMRLPFHRDRWIPVLLLTLACGAEGRPERASAAGSADTTPPAPLVGPPSPGPSAASGTGLSDTVRLTAQVTVGGRVTSFAGMGECHHTADASIYEVPASQWSARVESDTGALRHLNLTLWQPRAQPEVQVSLAATVGQSAYQIATVKGGQLRGTARAVIEPSGQGGTLKVDGRDADGRSVALTVQCSRFTEPVAEGG